MTAKRQAGLTLEERAALRHRFGHTDRPVATIQMVSDTMEMSHTRAQSTIASALGKLANGTAESADLTEFAALVAWLSSSEERAVYKENDEEYDA